MCSPHTGHTEIENKTNNKYRTMKKLTLIIAIVLGLTVGTYAQGGLFRRGSDAGNSPDAGYSFSNTAKSGDGGNPLLPNHNTDVNDNDQPAPLGSGVALLVGLGAAYLVGKKRDEE